MSHDCFAVLIQEQLLDGVVGNRKLILLAFEVQVMFRNRQMEKEMQRNKQRNTHILLYFLLDLLVHQLGNKIEKMSMEIVNKDRELKLIIL